MAKKAGSGLLRYGLCALTVCIGFALPVSAQTSPDEAYPGVFGKDDRKPVDSREAPWRSVGRVNVAGYRKIRFCTGTLIAPDLVVTAAHCLVNEISGRPFQPGSVHFVAGVKGDNYLAHSRARCMRFLGKPEFNRLPTLESFLTDVAVIALEKPMTLKPLAIDNSYVPVATSELTHTGYGRDDKYRLLAHRKCRPKGAKQGLLFTDCDTNHGGSGGPVLVRSGEDYKIVAAMSGVIQGRFSVAVTAKRWAKLLEPTDTCK